MKKAYVVMGMKKEVAISIFGKEVGVPFTGAAEGCIGCLLVFGSKETAVAWAGEADVIEIEVGEAKGEACCEM